MIEERIRLLREMNDAIIDYGDESIWSDWIAYGLPDEATDSDYEFIAEDDEEWEDINNLFDELTEIMEEEEEWEEEEEDWDDEEEEDEYESM